MNGLSIIIPIYNTPLCYFQELFSSLVILDKSIYQVIFINDGSTNSEIVNYFQNLNVPSNFVKINIPHSGVSVARNEGLKIAEKNYVMFLDSDDLLNFALLDNIFARKTLDSDILFLKSNFNPSKTYDNNNFDIVRKNLSLEYLYTTNRYLPEIDYYSYRTVVSKLFKTKIAKTVMFEEGIVYCEDCLYCGEIFKKAKTYEFVTNTPLYFYRPNENSQTRKIDKKFTKRFQLYFYKFIEINSHMPDRINFLMHDTIVTYLYVQVCMSLKKLNFVNAYRFARCKAVRYAANYYKDRPTSISKVNKKVCWCIRHHLILFAMILLANKRLKERNK